MKNTALTTYAQLKSGGTGAFWFDTDKMTIDDELIQEFTKRFPEIEKIHNLSLSSKERGKDMLPIRIDFVKL
jgi:hypothetical protein